MESGEKIKENENNPENIERKNPNSIGELISLGNDLPTRPDMVYRSVSDKAAIDDIESSGIVRNKQSAGLTTSRWGERVFWSKGKDGGYHNVSEGTYVIEAPLSIAEVGSVTKEDINAIYKKENGEVKDIWKEKIENEEKERVSQINENRINDAMRIEEVRKSLGME